jgi:hypothetical protein
MGTGKKEASRKEREGKPKDGMGNVKTKGENFYRYVQLPSKAPAVILTMITAMPRRSRP